ncbi:MAG: peptidoglycan-binding protein [Candidatus Tectomicrobia bacterium]|nr:peptidoglycan-binding protein [Candidatus Tectomicrobia bacterium]
MPKRRMYVRPFLIVALAACSVGAAGLQGQKPTTELPPPANKLGECYAQVFVPPAFEETVMREVVREEAERIEKTPAKYAMAASSVLIKEPSERLEVIPAVYDWVEERILVQPASERIEVLPPVYDTVTEKIVDTPGHSVWKKGAGPLQRLDHATGDIVCLVDVPTTYKTVQKRILKQAASTRTVQVPAQYRIVKKRILIKPASTRKVMVPGEYKSMQVKQLVEPARFKRIVEPAQYREVNKRVKVKDGRVEWQPVLCKTNVSENIIRSIQQALKQANHNPGPVDGVLGARTVTAIEAYQQDRGLPVGNLTLQTLQSLGVTVESNNPVPGLYRESHLKPNSH